MKMRGWIGAALLAVGIFAAGCEQKPSANKAQDQKETGAAARAAVETTEEGTTVSASTLRNAEENAEAGQAAKVSPIAPYDDPNAPTKVFMYAVTGMHCGGCEKMICDRLLEFDGVRKVQASKKQERVWVAKTDRGPTDDQIVEAIKGVSRSYTAEPLGERPPKNATNQPTNGENAAKPEEAAPTTAPAAGGEG